MKPFFGIDITDDKKNETVNAAPFIVQKPSAASVRKLEQEEEAATEALKEYFKKHSRKVDRFLCAVLFGFVAAALLFAALTFGLAHRLLEGYEHLSVPAVLVPGVVFAILSFVCGALYRKAGADPESDGGETEEDDDEAGEEDDEAGEEDDAPLSTTEATIFQELRIPKTTKSVDVIGFKYRDKRGRVRPHGRDGVNGATVYPLYTFKGYVKDDALCFACAYEGVYAVPLSEIRAIRTVDKRLYLPCWSKGTPLTHEKFKPYKLKTVRGGVEENLRVGWYHVLEFVHKGETWGIWFPNYELPFFEKATGLKADEQNTGCKELFTSDPTV